MRLPHIIIVQIELNLYFTGRFFDEIYKQHWFYPIGHFSYFIWHLRTCC